MEIRRLFPLIWDLRHVGCTEAFRWIPPNLRRASNVDITFANSSVIADALWDLTLAQSTATGAEAIGSEGMRSNLYFPLVCTRDIMYRGHGGCRRGMPPTSEAYEELSPRVSGPLARRVRWDTETRLTNYARDFLRVELAIKSTQWPRKAAYRFLRALFFRLDLSTF